VKCGRGVAESIRLKIQFEKVLLRVISRSNCWGGLINLFQAIHEGFNLNDVSPRSKLLFGDGQAAHEGGFRHQPLEFLHDLFSSATAIS
jgi:hypothetical protein